MSAQDVVTLSDYRDSPFLPPWEEVADEVEPEGPPLGHPLLHHLGESGSIFVVVH